jgi:hypothetical protein
MNRQFYPPEHSNRKKKSPTVVPGAEIEPQLKGRLVCSPVTTLTATHVLQTHITGTVQGRFVTTKHPWARMTEMQSTVRTGHFR